MNDFMMHQPIMNPPHRRDLLWLRDVIFCEERCARNPTNDFNDRPDGTTINFDKCFALKTLLLRTITPLTTTATIVSPIQDVGNSHNPLQFYIGRKDRGKPNSSLMLHLQSFLQKCRISKHKRKGTLRL